ncbi:MAG: hydroxymethylglutaryl-CoA lyase, partial [Planctomycetota bacterium]
MTEPVTVVEVGPRDGLQNECAVLSTEVKLAFVRSLASAGLSRIEVAAFVRPDRVPAMADAAEVAAVAKDVVPHASALVPNRRGLDGALAAGLSSVAVFASATEGFAQANLGQSVDGSLATFSEVLTQAKQANLHVRGYVSCAFDCPYDGAVDPGQVNGVVERLLAMGCDEIAISDTIGSAVPATVNAVLSACASSLPLAATALHLHDTRGAALSCVGAGLAAGVRTFDASAGGFGGCPFAPGAGG